MTKRLPRFVPILTPSRERKYRVLDRKTGRLYSASDDKALVQSLAAEYSRTFSFFWYQRLLAFVSRRPLPEPADDPIESTVVELEWKLRIRRINELIERRKQELARDDPYRQVIDARTDLVP